MSNLTINTSVAINQQQQQLQELIERQAAVREQDAALQAQIDSLSAVSASGSQHYHRSPIHKQPHHRRRDIPRNMPSTGAPSMSRHVSSVGTLWPPSADRSNDN